MTSLEIRVQPWVDTSGSLDTDTWATCNVESRVEFVLDGRTVSDLCGINAIPEQVTLFDVKDRELATDVLMGQRPLPDWFPTAGRIPLLVCPCGDPTEGKLTVRLSFDNDTVIWDQWAWESDYYPVEWLPDLPECRFRLDEYAAAIDEAGRLAVAVRGKASSIIHVKKQGDGIMRWIEKHVRGELACQLDWLDIEVVQPGVDNRGAELNLLLAEVESIRHELAESTPGRRYMPSREQSQRLSEAAGRILGSTEVFRLPAQTHDAVEWLRDRFSAEK